MRRCGYSLALSGLSSPGTSDDSKVEENVEKLPLHHALNFFYINGHHAVVIFWMISGFIFFWKYSRSVHAKTVSGRQFFFLRFSRLYPLHFVTLMIIVIFQFSRFSPDQDGFFAANNFTHFVMQLFMASNWVNGLPFSFDGPVWSVSVEVLAYAFFFLVVRFIKPSLLLCVIVAVVFKAMDHFLPQNVFVCIEYFFIGGALVALIPIMNRTQKIILFWSCVAGIVGIAVTRLGPGTVVVFAFCCVAAFVLFTEIFTARLTHISKLGDLTYASYLLHFPVQLAFVFAVDWFGIGREVFLSPSALLFYLGATFGLSWIAFHSFEVPAQSMIRAATLRQAKTSRAERPDLASERRS